MQEILAAIPPVTKVLGFATLGATIAATIGLVSPGFLIFDADLAFGKFQIWRFITGLIYRGNLSFPLVISLFFSFRVLMTLETTKFQNRKSQLVFIIILMSIVDLTLSGIMGSYWCASSLSSALMYLYGKLMAGAQVYIMMFPVPAQWAPFINIVLSIANGMDPMSEVVGLLTGHIIFYLLFILPVVTNTPIFKTPNILVRYLD